MFPKLCSRLREVKNMILPTLTMAEVKRMVHPLNVWKLETLLSKVKETLRFSFHKNIILVIGATGAGKSTFIQTVLGYKHVKDRDDKNRKVYQVEGRLSP